MNSEEDTLNLLSESEINMLPLYNSLGSSVSEAQAQIYLLSYKIDAFLKTIQYKKQDNEDGNTYKEKIISVICPQFTYIFRQTALASIEMNEDVRLHTIINAGLAQSQEFNKFQQEVSKHRLLTPRIVDYCIDTAANLLQKETKSLSSSNRFCCCKPKHSNSH